MTAAAYSPREIVSELDRFIVGQNDAKRAVAIALRNRWRRQQLSPEMRDEILPKNILMIGPTGVGKTEIARRLAKLARAPFLKVEATKFTEVGYVGRDVESMIRDLVEVAFSMLREDKVKSVRAKAAIKAEERVLDALVGNTASEETRQKFRKRLREGSMDQTEIELELADSGNAGMPMFEMPGMPGASFSAINLGEMLGKMGHKPTRRRKLKVADAYEALIQEESGAMIDEDEIKMEALNAVEQHGIVFIDEIDKVAGSTERRGGDVSREGVQRDLLPMIEGTTVATKYGPVKTDYILFIASGAFHVAKPADLLPELQGRLPIRVELQALDQADFGRILREPENSLIKQYTALLSTERVTLSFTEEAIDALAKLSADINQSVENIGARRLHTVLERLLDDISFQASDMGGQSVEITADMVAERVAPLAQSADLSRFIL